MRYIVYKSLDNPSSMFGIKGSYLGWVAAGAGAGLVVAVIAGGFIGGLGGVIVFLACLVASYLGTLVMQAKYSERERKKWLASRKIPDVVVFRPETARDMAEDNYMAAKSRTGQGRD